MSQRFSGVKCNGSKVMDGKLTPMSNFMFKSKFLYVTSMIVIYVMKV